MASVLSEHRKKRRRLTWFDHAIKVPRPSSGNQSRQRAAAPGQLEPREGSTLARCLLRFGSGTAGAFAARRSSPGRGRRLVASSSRGSGNGLPTARGRTSRAAAGKDDVVQGAGRNNSRSTPRRPTLKDEQAYWRAITEDPRVATAASTFSGVRQRAAIRRGLADTVKVALSVDETHALIQRVPAAYNTQINDVLLTALARAWSQWSGSSVLFVEPRGARSREPVRRGGSVPHRRLVHLDVSRPAGTPRVCQPSHAWRGIEVDQGTASTRFHSAASATASFAISSRTEISRAQQPSRPWCSTTSGSSSKDCPVRSCFESPASRRGHGTAPARRVVTRWK